MSVPAAVPVPEDAAASDAALERLLEHLALDDARRVVGRVLPPSLVDFLAGPASPADPTGPAAERPA